MEQFFSEAEHQDGPLRCLTDFLKNEQQLEMAKKYEDMRFVGYVLDIGFNEATIITSDPYKMAVGGVPRGSFLIMAPDSLNGMPPHFSLIRITDTAPTPLTKEVQQTYFELHKKAMPDLDVWTKGELQWGALKARVLGMFFPDPDDSKQVRFSGDVNNVVSAHRYKVYSPTKELQELIVNGIVRVDNQFSIGNLRLTECTLPFANTCQPTVSVNVSTDDFKGFRTAMFGKTRLGKSNVVKIIAQSILETTKNDKSVGQLIFDINGEYANDNNQDGSKSLRSAYEDRCVVYALTKRPTTPSKQLKLNFYESPAACKEILGKLLEQDNKNSIYIKSFSSVELPEIKDVKNQSDESQQYRDVRKIQIFWAILYSAGFSADETRLINIGLNAQGRYAPRGFDPHFNKDLQEKLYGKGKSVHPKSLAELQEQLIQVAGFIQKNSSNKSLKTGSGNPLFDSDDLALLNFLKPKSGSGPQILRPYIRYHHPAAGDFVKEILGYLDNGSTVILDLGNANEQIRRYFSDLLSREVFSHQERKFTSNNLNEHYVQLYFEEAHNLFPKEDKDVTGVYARFAKEGAKFHIGMIYSTQSPSTINKELLAQTENFFVAHMSSQGETDALAKLQVQYDGLQSDILYTRSPGYMRVMTFSHRFVVPVQVNKFEAVAP